MEHEPRAATERAAAIDVDRAYRRWATSYAVTGDNALTAATDEAMWAVAPPFERGARVLDLGCGLGRWAHRAAAAGARVTALDRVPEMAARCAAGGRRVAVAVADAKAVPLASGSMDVAVCALVVGHVPRPEPLLVEIARTLRLGGALVLADVHPEGAARGWRRTFRDAAGRPGEVPWWPHALPHLEVALLRAGFTLEAVDERPVAGDVAPAAYAIRARVAG